MKTKIVFMGTPDFSATVLQGLISSHDYEIVAVVTQPDRKVGRKQEIRETPVKVLAKSVGLLVLQPEKLSGSEEMAQLMAFGADGAGIVTAAFGQFLPGKLLDAMAFAVNVHGSLLPKYRGGAPIHHALMADEPEVGITLMEMVRKMDAGDMIAADSIPVTDEDNVGTLFEKLAIVGRDLLLTALPKYLSGEIVPQVQDETLVTISPNISAEEEVIDWSRSAREIFNQIRGLNPFPVAHTSVDGVRLKIYATVEVTGAGAAGTIIEKTKKSLVVACGSGALELLDVQPAGKPRMGITDFLNGAGRELEVGQKLG